MKTKDMTSGHPFKILLFFAIPMILSVTLQQLYNLADNFIAGHFITNLNSFEAVGIVYPVTVVFLDIAVGFGVGVGVVAARFFGAKDFKNVKKTTTTGFVSMLVLGAVTTIVGLAIMWPLLRGMIDTSKGDGCFTEAYSYMMIYIAGIIFLFMYNFSMYVFQSFGNSKTPLYFLIFSTLLNVALDFLFVIPCHMSSAGLALGTVISEAIAAILSIVVLFKSVNKLDSDKEKLFDSGLLKSIVSLATPSILQGCFISIGGVLITTILTSFGGNSVAGGYSAAYKICYIAINIFTVACNALSNFVSQNIGASKYDRIMKGYVATVIICAIICAVSMLIILPFREFWVRLFISDKAEGDIDIIVSSGKLFMLCVVPFFVLMVAKIPLDGILKGSTDMLGFTLGTSVDLALRVISALVLGKIFGYEGVFFAWPIGWAVGMLISIGMFFSGRWKRKCGYPKNLNKIV